VIEWMGKTLQRALAQLARFHRSPFAASPISIIAANRFMFVSA
jgi:hypothetical protein